METDDGWWGADKVKHAAASYVLYTAAVREGRSGWVVGISAGMMKEIYDGFFRKGFSYKDLLWDFLGMGLASFLNR